MKTKIITASFFVALFVSQTFAQDRTTVNATSSEISDNLDLRAVASIFGDAKNLEDFERQLNDPKIQISNLDLNNDNQVDYLRVIESVEGNTHLIIVQSVLGRDTFQDVATIEVERDRHNNIQVQVVGDVYMYGDNYIYEPVYVHSPIIYSTFWVNSYRPYYSSWYWDFYPTYYYAWNPCPIFRYRNNINIHINFNHHYNYVNVRRCERAIALHNSRRENYCERTYPNRSFEHRNTNSKNRYELDQTRSIRNVAYTNTRSNTRENQTIRNSNPTRENQPVRSSNPTREISSTRENQSIRNSNSTRENNSIRNNQPNRNSTPIRENSQPRVESPRANSEVRNNSQRENSQTRTSNGGERNGRR